MERSSRKTRRCALAPLLVSNGDQNRCSAYLSQLVSNVSNSNSFSMLLR